MAYTKEELRNLPEQRNKISGFDVNRFKCEAVRQGQGVWRHNVSDFAKCLHTESLIGALTEYT